MSQDSLRAIFFEYAGTDLDSFLQVAEFMMFAIDADLLAHPGIDHLVLVRLFDEVAESADQEDEQAPEALLNMHAFLVLLDLLKTRYNVRLDQLIDRLLTMDSSMKPSKRRLNVFVNDRELIDLVYSEKYVHELEEIAHVPTTLDEIMTEWKNKQLIPSVFVAGEVKEAAKRLLIANTSSIDRAALIELVVVSILRTPNLSPEATTADRVHAGLELIRAVKTKAAAGLSLDEKIDQVLYAWHRALVPFDLNVDHDDVAKRRCVMGDFIEEPIPVPSEFPVIESIRALRRDKQYESAIASLLAARAEVCKSSPGWTHDPNSTAASLKFDDGWVQETFGLSLDSVRSRQKSPWASLKTDDPQTVEKFLSQKPFFPCDEFFGLELASLLIGAGDHTMAVLVLDKIRINLAPRSSLQCIFWQMAGRAISGFDLEKSLRCFRKAKSILEEALNGNFDSHACPSLGSIYHNIAVIFARVGELERSRICAAFASELLRMSGDLTDPRLQVSQKFTHMLVI